MDQTIDRKNIEDLYPLSPMQQGMLFHSLLDRESGAYIEQMVCTLLGNLDVPAFERSWQRVVDRHAVLRTAFVGEGLREPAQVVLRKARLSLTQQDWRGLAPAERAARLEAFLRQDRKQGFELTKAPILRLALMQTAQDTYTFVWTYHHMLLDGWSIPLLFKEVFAFYEAFHSGTDLSIDLPRPYRDYIVWLRQHTQADAEAFWRRTLQGFSVPTSVKLYRPQEGQVGQEERYESLQVALDAPVIAALTTLARQRRMTLNTFAQAAWGLLLSRYSGENDVVFGVVVSGRPLDMAGVESMIGMFMNSVPMRVQMPSNARLPAWLDQVRALQLEMQQYEYSALVEVQSWSQVPRGTPLFETILVFQGDIPDVSFGVEGGSVEIVNSYYVEAVNYPMVVDVILNSAAVLKVLYNARQFDAGAVARMMGHFKTILERIVADPEQRLADLLILTDAEQRQLLVEWNNTATGQLPDQCFHQRFETQVEQTPDAIAVVFDGPTTTDDRRPTTDDQGQSVHPFTRVPVHPFTPQCLTYRQLDQRADLLAATLREQHVGTDAVVALLSERNLDFLTAMLAIFKAGGAYVPLDPRFPAQRLAQVLGQSRAPWVLCAEGQRPLLAEALAALPADARPQVLPLAQLPDRALCAEERAAPGTPSQLAYVIYTSGSTGVPKGAMIEQRGMLNHLEAKIRDLGLTSADRLAQTAPQSFDISVWQFLAPLLVGGCVQIFSDEVAFDPTRLLDAVTSWQVTVLETVPSLLRPILAATEPTQSGRKTLAALRWLMPTGEALPPDLARQWLSCYPHAALINAYGPTECSDDVAHYPLAQPPAEGAVRIPIGRPVLNTQLYVLDAQLHPVPLGVAGELYVGGAGVGRGYLHEPLKTAQVFLPNPFTTNDERRTTNDERRQGDKETGRQGDDETETQHSTLNTQHSRLYRTGDLVRYRSDGNLEFLERIDHQVKVRGFRIELGEIEVVLRQQPAVREAVVLVREDQPGDQRLVAYVVPKIEDRGLKIEDSQADVPAKLSSILYPLSSELRRFLQERLPAYMVPSAFVFLDALPLMPSGKLDRRALPAPNAVRPELEDGFVTPRTPVEQTVATIWAQVLGLEHVGAYDDFFGLGGHSLLVTQVVARVRQAFQIELPLSMLFEARTVAGLAKSIEAVQRVVQAPTVVAVESDREEWTL